eukprot:5801668-Lingulodinium_polyedra.AAC.1
MLFKCWQCKAALRVPEGLKGDDTIRPRTADEAEKRVRAIREGSGTVSASADADPAAEVIRDHEPAAP